MFRPFVLGVLLAVLVGCAQNIPMLGQPGHYAWRHSRSMDGVTLPTFPSDDERSCFITGRC